MATQTETRVVAGPNGHWYALQEGELVALPMDAGVTDPPDHPAEGNGAHVGWYAPDDLTGDAREQAMEALTHRIRVTFKNEDEVGGMIVGPVHVTDLDLLEADPKVKTTFNERRGANVHSWPFSYEPQGLTDLGWKSLRDARRVAAEYGVELEEV